MHVVLSERVAGVAPAEAASWWSDFREGRGDHAFVPNTRRRIVRRGEGHVTMEEETRFAGVRVFHEVVTAWPRETEVAFAGRNGLADFEGRYRFLPDAAGTRIVLDAEVRLVRRLAWSTFAARRIVERVLRADLAGHAKDMRRDLAPTGPRQASTGAFSRIAP